MAVGGAGRASEEERVGPRPVALPGPPPPSLFPSPSLMRLSILAAALCTPLLLAGCDAVSDSSAPSALDTATAPQADAHLDGAVYEARLRPLNASTNGAGVTGTATFSIDGGTLTATVDAKNLAVDSPFQIHAQHIHAGPECPSRGDDANGDRILDVLEGAEVYGRVLVGLDDDLDDLSFQTTFPTAESTRGRSGYGSYSYEESVSLTSLVDALDASDDMFGGELALETRHVVVHGVAADTELPESVATLSGPGGPLPAQLTLPVACGEIRRVR